MKPIIFLIAYSILLSASTVGCKRETRHSVDNDYLIELGYQYASEYNKLLEGDELTRQNFLLDVKTRQERLRQEVGRHQADIFSKAFADSAHIQ